MWFKAKAFLKFLWHSKNQHGIHSPFVYKLITKCFYNKEHLEAYELWDKAKKTLSTSNKVLEVQDIGAGSKIFKGNLRPVSKIAKHVSISRKRARLMSRLVDYLSVKNALELGTSIGLGSISIAGSGRARLTTIEACPATSAYAQSLFEKLKLTKITGMNSSFDEGLTELNPPRSLAREGSEEKFDLIFIDGHHDGEATLSYFESLLKHKHNDTLFILDDIHWSPAMEMAWEAIKTHEEVRVTIDTFQWGLVFFRKEQVKQDFVIRV
ncbi:O-methyltransferase [Psychroflexus sediminis]|uniref:Methyltransferase domain-containing protein n=1 Tax=Psychroflexus sediminis TaxID=470826 RepID=A0A1G7YHQ2_9FLAO|nr:class I SAM-dependent methyltransferase [Psychroflexus sediminis]SDG96092.1 Methyltransferase domain-containing protein [Psychroflexus sediminis]